MTICVAKRYFNKVLEKQEGSGIAILSNRVKQGDIIFNTKSRTADDARVEL